MEVRKMLKANDIVVLRHVKNNPYMSGYRMAEQLGMSRSSAYESLERLEEEGYINSANEITSKGEEALEFHKTVQIEDYSGGSVSLDRTRHNQYDLLNQAGSPTHTLIVDSTRIWVIPHQNGIIQCRHGTV
jgi:DNA-binding PadR family transcriptional regulator